MGHAGADSEHTTLYAPALHLPALHHFLLACAASGPPHRRPALLPPCPSALAAQLLCVWDTAAVQSRSTHSPDSAQLCDSALKPASHNSKSIQHRAMADGPMADGRYHSRCLPRTPPDRHTTAAISW